MRLLSDTTLPPPGKPLNASGYDRLRFRIFRDKTPGHCNSHRRFPSIHCLLHALLLIGLLVSISACETRPVHQPDTNLFDSHDYSAAEMSRFEQLARDYVRQADQSRGVERENRLLLAARHFYYAGRYDSASQVLATLQPDGPYRTAAALLSAQIAMADDNPRKAVSLLPDNAQLDPQQRLLAQGIRADADAALGFAMKAIESRVDLDARLPDQGAREKNSQKIWNVLASMSSTTLYQQHSADPRAEAWLDLARVMREFTSRGRSDTGEVETAVLDWATRHPRHTASNAFLSAIIDEYLKHKETVKTIAILLPQQGKYANAADTIKNGLLSAYYADDHRRRPELRFYDTGGGEVDINTLVDQAVQEGATNIIGPLDKSLINDIQPHQGVPILTLNYTEATSAPRDNLYQFGLAPEDEARQAAELAIKQGRQKAVILFPDSHWGKRLENAFRDTFEALGGTVLASADYSTASADYSRPIKKLLNLDQSARRHRQIEDILGEKLQYEPARRQDVEAIFIAATARAARGIVPAFKFHHAGDLPVYATSHAYSGNRDPDRDFDLNGLLFCDMPWILEPPDRDNRSMNAMLTLKSTFTRYWPQQQKYTRLFALGLDAYHLIYNVDYLHNHPYTRFPGVSGNLQLGDDNRIVRHLLWAKVRQGVAIYIEPRIQVEETTPDDEPPAKSPATSLPAASAT